VTHSISAAAPYTASAWGSGFITTTHGDVGNGANIYLGTSAAIVGVVKAMKHDGHSDTAFVKFNSGYTWATTTPYTGVLYEELSWYEPALGAAVKCRGYYSGTVSRTVTNPSYTEPDIEGEAWYDTIQISGGLPGGNSGGAVICGTQDMGRTARVVDVIMASNGVNTLATKGKYCTY
jgi:hypothetical protein